MTRLRDVLIIAVCAVVLLVVLATATVAVLGAVGHHEQASREATAHTATATCSQARRLYERIERNEWAAGVTTAEQQTTREEQRREVMADCYH